jgi:hypothetical protein
MASQSGWRVRRLRPLLTSLTLVVLGCGGSIAIACVAHLLTPPAYAQGAAAAVSVAAPDGAPQTIAQRVRALNDAHQRALTGIPSSFFPVQIPELPPDPDRPARLDADAAHAAAGAGLQ